MNLTDSIDNILNKVQGGTDETPTPPETNVIDPAVITITDNSKEETPEDGAILEDETVQDGKEDAEATPEVEETPSEPTNETTQEGATNMGIKDAIMGNQTESASIAKNNYTKEEMDAFFSFDRFFDVTNDVTGITYSMNGAEVEQIIGALPQHKHLKVKLMNGEKICKDATYTIKSAK